MSELVEQYLPLLEAIIRIKNPSDRRKVLTIFLKDHKLKKVLREIALNVVEKNVPLTQQQKRKLARYKSALWSLRSRKGVKQVIEQEGEGFLSILLPIVTSLIASSLDG